MKKILSMILVGAMTAVAFMPAWSEPEEDKVLGKTGGVASLRGTDALGAGLAADDFKRVPKDRETFERDYLHQPPLIPHQIRGYRVDTNSNKCLSCHSWKNYKKAGATKISMTHFDTRSGQTLSDVSPRRYFCLQCHVTQADAKPIVKNTFKSVDALGD